MPEENINEICEDCINWKQYGKKCFFFWEKKKECPSKIEEGEDQKLLF
jgi:hypothetical protein